MKSFYLALGRPTSNTTNATYEIWRFTVAEEVRPYISANKVANVRRDIMCNNQLTQAEIEQIKQSIKEIGNAESTINDEVCVEVKNIRSRGTQPAHEREEEKPAEEDPNVSDEINEDREEIKVEFFTNNRDAVIRATSRVKVTDIKDRENLPKIQATKAKKK